MKLKFEVVNGLPYANGKLVIFACSRDVSGEAERNYAEYLFPNTDWYFDYDDYLDEEQMLPSGTNIEDFKEVMEVLTKQMETGNYEEVESVEGYPLVVQCQTENQIMLVCDEEIEEEFGEES